MHRVLSLIVIVFSVTLIQSATAANHEVTIYVSGEAPPGPNADAAAALDAASKFKALCVSTCRPNCNYQAKRVNPQGKVIARSKLGDSCTDSNPDDGKFRGSGTCLCSCPGAGGPTPPPGSTQCSLKSDLDEEDLVSLERFLMQ